MSMEQAITDHAAAIRELAAAIRGAASSNLAATTGSGAARIPDAEEEAAVAKVETDAKAKQKEVMAAVESDRKPTAARAAIEDALAKARAEKEAEAKKAKESATATQNAQSQGAGQDSDDPLDAAPLDWDKDVRPALLAVGKDRGALVKLMAKYEVPKGGKAPAEKWADLLAEANAIVAARG